MTCSTRRRISEKETSDLIWGKHQRGEVKRCVVNTALFHQSEARFQTGKILSKTICKSRLPRRLPWPGFFQIAEFSGRVLKTFCSEFVQWTDIWGQILFCRGCNIACHFLIIVTVKSFNTARQTSFIGPLFFEPQLKCCKVLGWRYIALSVLQPSHCGGEREDTIFNCSCIVAWKEREREETLLWKLVSEKYNKLTGTTREKYLLLSNNKKKIFATVAL